MLTRASSVIFTLVVCLCLAPFAGAEEFEKKFETHLFTNAEGKTLPYRLMKPENYQANSSVKYPLVLFLHGAGERGTDNVKTLVHGMREFAKDEVRDKYPCFVVAPQCPQNLRWVEVDWKLDSHEQLPDDSATMKLVLELLPKLQRELRFDENRLYVTGLSMGGFGTWDLITRHPDLFAAAAPICAGGDESVAHKAVKLPIWTFHGDADTICKVSRSRNMVVALVKAGGTPIYTEYPGMNHASWISAYGDPRLMEWLFAQRKP